MARRYSKKKGKSGSTNPLKIEKPTWVTQDAKTIEQVIVKLAKQEETTSKIGIILRDSYGVPNVKAVCGKTILGILKNNKIIHEIPEDLLALIKRDLAVAKHLELNKKDMTAKRGQQLTMSKISKLVKYYKTNGVLTKDWTYDRSKAAQWIV
jgi:small subunit ribosomal protein S15